MDKVNHEQRAAIGWEVLTAAAKSRELITYAKLAEGIGIHHRVVRNVLGLIQDYCLERMLPPLTILVVNQSALPGNGFIAWEIDDFEEGKKKVHNYNWENERNPFGYAKDGLTEIQIVGELLDNPNTAEENYGRIKVRGVVQSIFRRALLKAYDCQCAICGLTFEDALEAAHIKPWADSNKQERLDVRNGLLLCSTHHNLFDTQQITIAENFTIHYYDAKEEDGTYSEYDTLMTTSFHGKKLKLPKKETLWPCRKILTWYRESEGKPL